MTDSPLLPVLAVLLVALPLVATPAGAVSATANGTPDGARVGENVSATVVLDDLYTEAPTAWRLHADTELRNVTWTVTAAGLDGSTLATRSFRGRSFDTPVRAAQNVSELTVRVRGTAPPVENFTYQPREEFALAALARGRNGSRVAIADWSAAHYTPESRSARRTLNATQAAVAEDGSDDLEERFGFAVMAYRNESFGLSNAIASDVKTTAERPDYPVAFLSGLFLGAIAVGLGAAGLRSYRERAHDGGQWSDR